MKTQMMTRTNGLNRTVPDQARVSGAVTEPSAVAPGPSVNPSRNQVAEHAISLNGDGQISPKWTLASGATALGSVINRSLRSCSDSLPKPSWIALLALGIMWLVPGVARASDETDVRSVVQQVFQQLRSHDYGAVYDSLPSSTRSRMSRERFTTALKRAQDRYVLDRLTIGAVRVSGNLAVADTELYGRLANPFEAEGKIVVQQYLVRENGKWRVATGDTATIQQFLKANPKFAKKFPIRQPQIYVKQDGKWMLFNMRGK